MIKNKRVVITGLGVISPIGTNINDFFNNSLEGVSGVKEIKDFKIPENVSRIAGIVENFKPTESDESFSSLDRSIQFAIVAARNALLQADLINNNKLLVDPKKCSVYVSSAIGGIISMEKNYINQYVLEQNLWPQKSNSSALYKAFSFNNLSRSLYNKFGFKGGHCVLTTGCTGGIDAVGYALQSIRSGETDVVLTGASEAPITPLVVSSFSKINATSLRNHDPEGASRPFDKERDGFVLAEGCGMLVLESLEHALKRGANILAEIHGYGSCNNALHMTNIPQDGKTIAQSINLALNDSNVAKEEINYINLHGSSTPQNDIAESNALHEIFGGRGSEIPVTSTKSLIGHALSASNSIELVNTVLSIQLGKIPPTRNLNVQDENCKLNVVKKAQSLDVKNILKISSGFSGIHSSIVLGKYYDRGGI